MSQIERLREIARLIDNELDVRGGNAGTDQKKILLEIVSGSIVLAEQAIGPRTIRKLIVGLLVQALEDGTTPEEIAEEIADHIASLSARASRPVS